jgi:hypothetical protein
LYVVSLVGIMENPMAESVRIDVEEIYGGNVPGIKELRIDLGPNSTKTVIEQEKIRLYLKKIGAFVRK